MIDFFGFSRTANTRPLHSSGSSLTRDRKRLLKRIDAVESRTGVAA